MINEAYKPKKWGQYNDVVPHVIKGFFTKEELDEVYELINYGKSLEGKDDFHAPLVLPKMARQQIELKFAGKLLEKIEKFASDFVGEEVKMTHNSYLSYNKKHNPDADPKLPPHFDSDNYFTKLTMDYQLEANVDWPVVIDVNGEVKSFSLEYGDLLVFWGAGAIHWREPMILDNGDNCEVLTMHFATWKDFEELNLPAREPEARELRMKEWKEKSKYSEYQHNYDAKMVELKDAYIRKQNNA
jgi:hypothetical protein